MLRNRVKTDRQTKDNGLPEHPYGRHLWRRERTVHRTMKRVGELLDVGTIEYEKFIYRGLRVTTVWVKANQFEIVIDGDDYIRSLDDMQVSAVTNSDSRLLRPKYRLSVGSLGFAASAYRPD
eukprot:Plantae.Rhodophyta-Rhodochaete_pulchella.ctg1395.p2 GENE.Plantae.Rhodophyta-Rhodochaete_pulchella.ctg1395~~Plantae.Rhodophyta-Rhodochaete_pulchella.ctg1395.p2  ORF type:complete len:122 (+),score=9.55 Plantae.Rhodophyta-Rhodochaete_pulchella.ctg1395:360-725(+)